MKIIIVSPQVSIIIYTALMGFASLVTWVVFSLLKSRYSSSSSGESSDVYIGGEPSSILSRLTESSESMYWGFVRYVARSLYKYFRDLMHSGKLSDWAGYMSGWYGFLMVLAIIFIVYYTILSGG